MRLEQNTTDAIEVVLSRRNIETLLAKLNGHPNPSAKTIYFHDGLDVPTLIVRAEENDEHYAHPSREGTPPGQMHPDTEDVMAHTHSG